jgi:hypothetical protein
VPQQIILGVEALVGILEHETPALVARGSGDSEAGTGQNSFDALADKTVKQEAAQWRAWLNPQKGP